MIYPDVSLLFPVCISGGECPPPNFSSPLNPPIPIGMVSIPITINTYTYPHEMHSHVLTSILLSAKAVSMQLAGKFTC